MLKFRDYLNIGIYLIGAIVVLIIGYIVYLHMGPAPWK